MMGWMISLYRQRDGGSAPATVGAEQGALVAQWQGGVEARRWLLDLVPTGSAVDLGGSGYPSMMSTKAGAVIPVVRDGAPHENRLWHAGRDDILGPGWAGQTVFNESEAALSDDEEWLIVEAWDES